MHVVQVPTPTIPDGTGDTPAAAASAITGERGWQVTQRQPEYRPKPDLEDAQWECCPPVVTVLLLRLQAMAAAERGTVRRAPIKPQPKRRKAG